MKIKIRKTKKKMMDNEKNDNVYNQLMKTLFNYEIIYAKFIYI